MSSPPLNLVLFVRSIWEASRSRKNNGHVLLFAEVVQVQPKAKWNPLSAFFFSVKRGASRGETPWNALVPYGGVDVSVSMQYLAFWYVEKFPSSLKRLNHPLRWVLFLSTVGARLRCRLGLPLVNVNFGCFEVWCFISRAWDVIQLSTCSLD